MTKAADDFEAIRRRIEELKAERDLALTGTTVPVEETKEFDVYGMYAYPTGYGGKVGGGFSNQLTNQDSLRALYQKAADSLKSPAHPEWPYAGTAHEWRGFVKDKKIQIKTRQPRHIVIEEDPIYQKQNLG